MQLLASMKRRQQFQYLLALAIVPFNRPEEQCQVCKTRYVNGVISHLPTCSQYEQWRKWERSRERP